MDIDMQLEHPNATGPSSNNFHMHTRGPQDVDLWPEVGGGLQQGLKKFNICTSKIYFCSHVAMPDASAAPPIGFDT